MHSSLRVFNRLTSVTATVRDAHGVDANSVGANSAQPHGPENRSQRLSQSVTVPNGYPVTVSVFSFSVSYGNDEDQQTSEEYTTTTNTTFLFNTHQHNNVLKENVFSNVTRVLLVSVFSFSVSYGNDEAQQTSEEYMTTTIFICMHTYIRMHASISIYLSIYLYIYLYYTNITRPFSSIPITTTEHKPHFSNVTAPGFRKRASAALETDVLLLYKAGRTAAMRALSA